MGEPVTLEMAQFDLRLLREELDLALNREAVVRRERDEARAEVERLHEGIEGHVARPGKSDHSCALKAEAEMARLRTERSTLLCGEGCSLAGILDGQDGVSRCAEHDKRLQIALRTVAEAQREACAKVLDGPDAVSAAEVRATPLVTEGDK